MSVASFRVEDMVGLETKTTMPRCQVLNQLSNAWEVCQESKCAFEAVMLRRSLILAESACGEFEDIASLRARPNRETNSAIAAATCCWPAARMSLIVSLVGVPQSG